MQGGRVQPPATLTDAEVTAASGLSPRMSRLRWASDKQSWLPVCGQSPVQPPAAVGGNGEKGTDGGTGVLGGRADEEFIPTTVSPPAHDGSLPQQQGPEKVEEAVAPTTVSTVAQNGAVPLPWQKGSDKVDTVAIPAAVSPIVQNGTLPQQGGNKVEEVVALAAVSPAMHSDTLSCALPRSGLHRARQDGNRGENGEAQLLGDAGELLLDGQEGNRVVEVASPSPAVAVMESYGIVGASSMHNSDKEACLLAVEEQGHGGSSVVAQEEVTADGDVVEMGNRTGGSELQRKENEIAGSRRKRLLKSDVNPSPKKWAVSPVREPRAVVDDKMKRLEGSLQRSNLRTPLSDSIDAKTKGNGLESGKMNATMLGNGEASAKGKVQSKTSSAKKEVMCSNMNIKQKKFARKLKGDGIVKDNLHRSAVESKLGKHVATNQIEESYVNLVADQVIVQAMMAPDKCPWTRGRKSIASASKSLVPRNKIKGKYASPKELLTGQVVSRELINDETVEDNDDTNLEEDDNSRELVVYGEKREIFVTPSVPSGSHRKQPGGHIDARSKVRKLLQLYQVTYRKLTQIEEQGIHKVGSIYLEAAKAVKKDPIYKKIGAIVGNIPGVEVGDEFHFRIELSIVGLHRQYQGGIDISKVNGVPVAISVVASRGYPDELSSSGELIYTGSGGKAGGNKDGGDQKLERGNLALKNCIETKTPVRVIHGFKGRSRSEVGKQTSTFTYDGLYEVVECWQEGPKGGMVIKYKLQRIAGQPELALHAVKANRKSKVREGLCLPDISQGSERIAICVINTIDDMRLAPFKYITNVIYPTWYEKEPQKACDCTNGCSDSITCACAVKNGGEIPFNFDSAIIEAKRLIYECGPWCRCSPTCYNRVSQHGVKIPLEIFKTGQ
ncbi:uncharacterized protein [Miscanthus floridulus]|uniref:uncharacterized protein isoform X2 n=1 Tax=Miscanthus floridulus TaxID=154761 RepID=UPI0034576935